VTITIGADTAAASKTVQAFVTAYNDLVDAVAAATKYDPLARKAAALTGDSAIRGLAATTRRLATARRSGAGMYARSPMWVSRPDRSAAARAARPTWWSIQPN